MTIKLNAATGGGSVSLSAPNSTTSNLDVELTLPVDDGAANTFLRSDGSERLAGHQLRATASPKATPARRLLIPAPMVTSR